MRRRIRVVGAMIEKDGRYLITQRSPTASLPLLWEFPGGRVEEGETDEAALARVANELNELVNNAHDQVLFFNLGPADGHGALPAKVIGKPVKAVERTVIVI